MYFYRQKNKSVFTQISCYFIRHVLRKHSIYHQRIVVTRCIHISQLIYTNARFSPSCLSYENISAIILELRERLHLVW